MKLNINIFFLLQTINLFSAHELISQESTTLKNLSGREFVNKGALPYIEENLLFNSDNSFQHTFKDKQNTDVVSGNWKTKGDTLILYNYIKDTLVMRGMETQVSFHDSIEIHFVDDNGRAWAPRVFINGRCLNIFPSTDLKYVIPKMNIQTISVLGGIYKVQNKNSNNFLINYRIDASATKVHFAHRISKCLISENYLTRIDCENYVDEGYKLEKK